MEPYTWIASVYIYICSNVLILSIRYNPGNHTVLDWSKRQKHRRILLLEHWDHTGIYRIPLQCVDPLGCITSGLAGCITSGLAVVSPPVSRDTALHKQLDVIQLTRSTHCSSIPFIIDIDKEDKTNLRTFRYFSFQVSKSCTMFYNKVICIEHRGYIHVCWII